MDYTHRGWRFFRGWYRGYYGFCKFLKAHIYLIDLLLQQHFMLGMSFFQIGFNAGNGTRSFEYKPYSQTAKFGNILHSGNVNNFPGRHIFRIDEKIMSGQCIPEICK